MSISASLSRSEGIALRRFFDLELLDNRYPPLHGLRVLALLAVMQHDVTMFLGLPLNPQWAATSMSLFFGMDAFFVLSGFLIGSKWIPSIESSHQEWLGRFWLRRALRTIPAYCVLLTLLALVYPLSAAQRRHLWFEYFFVSNYRFPLASGDLVMPWGWSIALLVQLYLAASLLFFVLRKVPSDSARMIALLILWTSALLIRLCLWLRHPDWDERTLCDFLYYRTHARFDAFVAGLLLAHVHHRWQAPIARWFQDPRARAAVALTSLTCLWLLAHPWMFGPWAARPMHVLAWGTLTSILYSGWILLLVHGGRGWLERVLSAPVLRSLATLSYGVYLSYVPICAAIVRPGARLLVNGHDWPISLVWPLAVAVLSILSLSAARVLHVLVEKPCLRLRYARH